MVESSDQFAPIGGKVKEAVKKEKVGSKKALTAHRVARNLQSQG